MIIFKMADTPEKFKKLATEYESRHGWAPDGKERYAFEAWLDDAIITKAREVCNQVPDKKPTNAMGYSINSNIRAAMSNPHATPRFDWGDGDGLHVSASLTYDRLNGDTEAVWSEKDLWVWKGPLDMSMDAHYVYNGREDVTA